MTTVTLEQVRPFIEQPIPASKDATVTAWLTAISAFYTHRYGDRITTDLLPMFVSAAADAVARRLGRPGQLIESQTVGGAAVRYGDGAATRTWFLPAQLAELDQVAGLGGVRTYRTPAPDGIRYGNLLRSFPYTDDCFDDFGGS